MRHSHTLAFLSMGLPTSLSTLCTCISTRRLQASARAHTARESCSQYHHYFFASNQAPCSKKTDTVRHLVFHRHYVQFGVDWGDRPTGPPNMPQKRQHRERRTDHRVVGIVRWRPDEGGSVCCTDVFFLIHGDKTW